MHSSGTCLYIYRQVPLLYMNNTHIYADRPIGICIENQRVNVALMDTRPRDADGALATQRVYI
jgi:hypothetical protein